MVVFFYYNPWGFSIEASMEDPTIKINLSSGIDGIYQNGFQESVNAINAMYLSGTFQ